jgi:Rieske Fe-S protein
MDRKTFIYKSGAALMLTSLGINLSGCSSEDEDLYGSQTPQPNPVMPGNTVVIDLYEEPFDVLNSNDAWLLHPDENIILVNVGIIRAFTSVCTHSGCSRNWSRPDENFLCACHGSQFNSSGQVVDGPANRPLEEFAVQRDVNILTISVPA